jgi:sulfonate transport system substrate-binding protein
LIASGAVFKIPALHSARKTGLNLFVMKRNKSPIIVNVGGVHEYTNLPFIYGIMNQFFRKVGIILRWVPYPSGSAPLAAALAKGTIHLAVILTDSVIKSIAEGSPLTIISPFADNPLKWLFHVNGKSSISREEDIKGKVFAISRFGSGGHLIALAWARRNNVILTKENFLEVGDINGAEKALAENHDLVFPWEGVTTYHLVESGLFKVVHTEESLPQPFCIACSKYLASNDPENLREILRVIHHCIVEISQLPEDEAVDLITAAYNRNRSYVSSAYGELQWSFTNTMMPGLVSKVIAMLKDTGAIPEDNPITEVDVVTVL